MLDQIAMWAIKSRVYQELAVRTIQLISFCIGAQYDPYSTSYTTLPFAMVYAIYQNRINSFVKYILTCWKTSISSCLFKIRA